MSHSLSVFALCMLVSTLVLRIVTSVVCARTAAESQVAEAQVAQAANAGGRAYRRLADVPRDAWFRDTWREDAAPVHGRCWARIVAVRHGNGTKHCQDVVVFDGGFSAAPAELSATYVFTRDPYVPVPIEWPCRLGAETAEEL